MLSRHTDFEVLKYNTVNCRVAFDEDRVPNLYDDRGVLQDIHSVSSLLKMYFRELPNPVCTYHLYEKFVEAAKAPENQRLVLMRDVVQQLPPPNYRYEQKLAQFCQLFTFCKNF